MFSALFVKVEKASKVMEVLIVGFASTELFGRELIEYFTRETNTSISRVEKFKYEFRFPKDIPSELTDNLNDLFPAPSISSKMLMFLLVVVLFFQRTTFYSDVSSNAHRRKQKAWLRHPKRW